MVTADHSHHHKAHDVKAVFAEHGIRCTRPRMTIYEALCNTKAHPTAEQLHQIVKDQDSGISLATIYNTLELLVDQGLARRIANRGQGSGANRYDADQAPHLHLVLNDGRVIDAPSNLSKRLTDAIPQDVLNQLAKHAGVSALKIEIVEDTTVSEPAAVN